MFNRLLLLYLTCSLVYATRDAPEVEIKQGRLRGTYEKTWKGRTFSAFSGIAYAEPPVGDLRFKPPVPAESWNGVLDATKFSSICTQTDFMFNDFTVKGDEDCLYLNIYTPQLPDSTAKLLPVMFYIHGGGFQCGSGNRDLYGPDFLLEKYIVLVTINYRLGALGFLSTEDEVIPGNNGLKDQNLALKWVKQNIASFGGDPEKITVFGQSAGGASTHFHILSPLSKDLISGAIVHSGSAVAQWVMAQKGETGENTRKLAKFLDCPTSSSQNMLDCLKKVDAYDIAEIEKKFWTHSNDSIVPFLPVIEPDIEGAFLTEDPVDTIKKGKAADIPIIVSLTTEEGAFKAAGLYNDSNLIDQLSKDFDKLLPTMIQYDKNTENKDYITKKIKEFYFKNKDIDSSTKSELTNLFTDVWFMYPQSQAVRLHAKYSKQPVYYLLFGYRGSLSFTTVLGDSSYNYGVCHCDELLYLFSMEMFPDYKPNTSEQKITEIMTSLWSNFAATGVPTLQTDALIQTKWKPVQDDHLSYYFIKDVNDINMANDLYKERLEFWENLPTGFRIFSNKDEL